MAEYSMDKYLSGPSFMFNEPTSQTSDELFKHDSSMVSRNFDHLTTDAIWEKESSVGILENSTFGVINPDRSGFEDDFCSNFKDYNEEYKELWSASLVDVPEPLTFTTQPDLISNQDLDQDRRSVINVGINGKIDPTINDRSEAPTQPKPRRTRRRTRNTQAMCLSDKEIKRQMKSKLLEALPNLNSKRSDVA